MGMTDLKITISNSIEEAPDYKKLENVKPATLAEAVIVRNGTEKGNDTVDLVFTDADGNAFVALVTARILKSLAGLTHTNDR